MKTSSQRGFSLLELMITVAVVGILASIAYPAYQGQVRGTRRADAQAELLRMANFLERFYTENGRYDQDMALNPVALPPPSRANVNYTFALNPLPTATTYTIRATPNGPQTVDGYLELLESGARRWDKNNNNAIDPGENDWKK